MVRFGAKKVDSRPPFLFLFIFGFPKRQVFIAPKNRPKSNYFAASKRAATSAQLITLKNAVT
jgi:hypothetical protein